MDAESLLLSLELASGSGQGLSPDRRASLLTSLTLVKRDYRYDRVLFWGRILGLNADYYIAQGLSEDQLAPRKTLYRWGRCPDGQRPKGDIDGRVMGAGRGGPRCPGTGGVRSLGVGLGLVKTTGRGPEQSSSSWGETSWGKGWQEKLRCLCVDNRGWAKNGGGAR